MRAFSKRRMVLLEAVKSYKKAVRVATVNLHWQECKLSEAVKKYAAYEENLMKKRDGRQDKRFKQNAEAHGRAVARTVQPLVGDS